MRYGMDYNQEEKSNSVEKWSAYQGLHQKGFTNDQLK
jgi:hypothetical protein